MLHKALEQFLTDVYWDDPDYLLVDLPPGTGDISISLAQFLPRAEVYVVTTPAAGGPAGRPAGGGHGREGQPRRQGRHREHVLVHRRRRQALRDLRRRRRPATSPSGSTCRCSARCRCSPSCGREPTRVARSWSSEPDSEAAQVFAAIAEQHRRRAGPDPPLPPRAQADLSVRPASAGGDGPTSRSTTRSVASVTWDVPRAGRGPRRHARRPAGGARPCSASARAGCSSASRVQDAVARALRPITVARPHRPHRAAARRRPVPHLLRHRRPALEERRRVPAAGSRAGRPARRTLTLRRPASRLPPTRLTKDFQCVTGWRVADVQWSGVKLADLLDHVGVKPGATHLRFTSFDGAYTETLTMEQARRDDVLVAYADARQAGHPGARRAGAALRRPDVRLQVAASGSSASRSSTTSCPATGRTSGYDVDGWVGQLERPRRRADQLSMAAGAAGRLASTVTTHRPVRPGRAVAALGQRHAGARSCWPPGSILYVGSLSAARRPPGAAQGHPRRTRGLALPVPFLVAATPGGGGRGSGATRRRLGRFLARRLALAAQPRAGPPGLRLGKFNAGQKLNAIFVAGVPAGDADDRLDHVLEPPVLRHAGAPAPRSSTTGASSRCSIVVVGHIAKALVEPAMLRAMLPGLGAAAVGRAPPAAVARRGRRRGGHRRAGRRPADADVPLRWRTGRSLYDDRHHPGGDTRGRPHRRDLHAPRSSTSSSPTTPTPSSSRPTSRRRWPTGRCVWLTDKRGRQVGVPADKVAYVEIGRPDADHRIGFGG